MAERWEMCRINSDNLMLYNSQNFQFISNKKFVEAHGQKVPLMDVPMNIAICILLAEGWEPYAATGDERNYHFRRKVQS